MISPKDYILSVGSESVLFAHKVDLLLDEDEIDEALELCEEGVKRFPFYAEGYVQLARCYQLKNMNEEAIKAYQQALNLQPGHVKALKGLAYLFYKMRKKELGENTLLNAYLFNPYDEELHEFLESEGLLSRLYTPPIFEEEEEDATRSEGAMLDLEEILDDTRPSDEDERNQILEEIDEHSSVNENDLFDVKSTPQEEIEKIDESFFEVDSSLNEEEADSFPDELSAVTPGLGADQQEQESEEEQSAPAVPEKTEAKPDFDEREEFTQWMSDLFKTEEQTDEDVKEIEEEQEKHQTEETPEPEEHIVSDLDTILIFSDHRNQGLNGMKEDETTEEGERPLGDFNSLEEDLERISSTEFEEIEKHMVEPESDLQESALPETEEKQEKEESSSEVDEVLKRLEESDKRRDESSLQRVQIDQLESQAENDNVNIEDILSNPSLLTPTFGEILIAQHKFEDALKVFKALAEKDPDNPRIQKKIEFLKKLVVAKK